MKTLLRFFFRLLYHQFAFTYDLVAATVSLGRWKDWVMSVLPFVQGTRILEIGHGPGHLQRALLERNLLAVGLDESTQMGQLARHNLTRILRSKTENNHSARRGSSRSTPLRHDRRSPYLLKNHARYEDHVGIRGKFACAHHRAGRGSPGLELSMRYELEGHVR